MLEELTTGQKVVGLKQTRRAISEGKAAVVYLACDADPLLTDPLEEECSSRGIPVKSENSMAELGKACQIKVGTAAAAILR